ncbi:ScbR family autoregulator-binding transcription factor [Streptomyces sp. B6B3]|uniref:ScbR family autoregulator-binding transcription factor n=1 Tax=Streptomyces sp. B6B3 TaxID=3153570 RepID=UPI00325F2B81
MSKQERAGRTRRLLIEAAAEEFACHGYAGTSLHRISSVAGVTIGALTFHFSVKSALADAVCEHGCELTNLAVRHAMRRGRPPLETVVDITRALARLLNGRSAVRAAARLSRERPGLHVGWYESWIDEVRQLLLRARREGSLRPDHDPEAVTVLVCCLAAGLEVTTTPACAPTEPGSWNAPDRLDEVWTVVASGITPPDATPNGVRRGNAG